MNSRRAGKNTSTVEVLSVTKRGVWIFVQGCEHFLDYDLYPWFREAPVSAVFNVRLLRGVHLHWPDLNVDLMVDGLADPKKYPLVSKVGV